MSSLPERVLVCFNLPMAEPPGAGSRRYQPGRLRSILPIRAAFSSRQIEAFCAVKTAEGISRRRARGFTSGRPLWSSNAKHAEDFKEFVGPRAGSLSVKKSDTTPF
jgi:hypothetical protein